MLMWAALVLATLMLLSSRREAIDRWSTNLIGFLVLSIAGGVAYCEVRDVQELRAAQLRVTAILASNDPCDAERVTKDESGAASKDQQDEVQRRRAECLETRAKEKKAKQDAEWKRQQREDEARRRAEADREADEAQEAEEDEKRRKGRSGRAESQPSRGAGIVQSSCPALMHLCGFGSDQWCCPSGSECYPEGSGSMRCARMVQRRVYH